MRVIIRPAALMARLKNAVRLYAGLPRSIYVLFVATVVNGLGVFVFPFMTLILTKKLGFDEARAGFIMMVMSLAYVPGALIGGKLSDHFGRKRILMVSQLVSVAAFIPCGFLGNSWLVVVFIMISLLFDGVTDPTRGAMQMDLTTPENRQAAFSFLYLGHNLGFAGGPLIAGFLFNVAPQWMFWGNAIAAGLAVMLVLAFVPETRPSEAQIEASLRTESSERAVKGGFVKALLSRPYLLVFVFITTWYGFVYAQHRFTLPLQAEALFGSGGASLYGLLMTTNAIVVVLFNIPIVSMLKRFNPIFNTAISGYLYAIGFGMIAFLDRKWMFFLSTFVWTLGEIVNATNSEVYIANHTPMSHRARFNALLPLIWGFGWAISAPVSGAFAKAAGLPLTWIMVGIVAVLSATAVLFLGRAEQRHKRLPED